MRYNSQAGKDTKTAGNQNGWITGKSLLGKGSPAPGLEFRVGVGYASLEDPVTGRD